MEEIKRDFSDKAIEDFRLIDMAVSGDDKAYARLLQRYKRPVYHMILKMVRNVDDAEDLTIESFAKAFRSLHRFKKDFTFSTWLFRIATNNTIDFIRKKKLNTLSIENTFTDDDGQSVSIDVEAFGSCVSVMVASASSKVPATDTSFSRPTRTTSSSL